MKHWWGQRESKRELCSVQWFSTVSLEGNRLRFIEGGQLFVPVCSRACFTFCLTHTYTPESDPDRLIHTDSSTWSVCTCDSLLNAAVGGPTLLLKNCTSQKHLLPMSHPFISGYSHMDFVDLYSRIAAAIIKTTMLLLDILDDHTSRVTQKRTL